MIPETAVKALDHGLSRLASAIREAAAVKMSRVRPLFSSEQEERVSQYFERFSERSTSQPMHVLRHLRETVGVLRAVRALPVLRVSPSSGRQGEAISAELDQAWLRRTLLAGATSALGLPEDPADYTRGSSSSRYTLRKRGSAARTLGVRVERVDLPEERRDLCRIAEAYERVNPRAGSRNAQADNRDMLDHRFWFVAKVDERPVLLAVLPAEGRWAALRYFRTLEESEVATLSRYLMMQEMVTALVSSGVRAVIVGLGPHRMPNGVRQFQRMMGYRIVRVRLRAAGATARGERSTGLGMRLRAALSQGFRSASSARPRATVGGFEA